MLDASYYENLQGRAKAVLIGVGTLIRRDQASLLDELIDHNETGVAVEMMGAMLAEAHAPVTAEQVGQIESLARDMGLDESVVHQVRALVVRP
jgi:hypothetical protein